MSRKLLNASFLIALSVVSCSMPEGSADQTTELAATIEDKRPLPDIQKSPGMQLLVDLAKANLIERLAKEHTDVAGKVAVIQADQVTWRSSALGCPQPDRGYLMVLTPGVLIKLRAAGRLYEYHGSLRGTPFLCEAPGRIESPAPQNSSLDPT